VYTEFPEFHTGEFSEQVAPTAIEQRNLPACHLKLQIQRLKQRLVLLWGTNGNPQQISGPLQLGEVTDDDAVLTQGD
jgi:hypothetical protein